MDGITEPVVLILGHPIAGNPAQFALERGFASLELEWRVLSSDVAPQKLDQAIAGGEVLGFRGLLLDDSLAGSETDETRPNCLFRVPESEAWEAEDALTAWLKTRIDEYVGTLDREFGSLLWIGPVDSRFPADLREQESQSPIAWASPELIKSTDLVAITESIDVTDWPQADEATLVVDLAPKSNDVEAIRALGYNVVDRLELSVGTLTHCIERWTGRKPAADVVAEAIEEYLAV